MFRRTTESCQLFSKETKVENGNWHIFIFPPPWGTKHNLQIYSVFIEGVDKTENIFIMIIVKKCAYQEDKITSRKSCIRHTEC